MERCANCNGPIPANRRGSWYCRMACEVEAEDANEAMQIALELKHYQRPGRASNPLLDPYGASTSHDVLPGAHPLARGDSYGESLAVKRFLRDLLSHSANSPQSLHQSSEPDREDTPGRATEERAG